MEKKARNGFGQKYAGFFAFSGDKFTSFPVYSRLPQSARLEHHRINWTPKKARHALLLRITILIPLDPSTRLVGLFDF